MVFETKLNRPWSSILCRLFNLGDDDSRASLAFFKVPRSTATYPEVPQSTKKYPEVSQSTKKYFGRWLPSTSRYSELYRWLHQDDQTIHSWLHSSRPSSMETGSALRFYPKVIFMLGYKGPSVDRWQKESTLGLNFYRSQSLWSKSYSCSIKIVNMLALLEPPNHN